MREKKNKTMNQKEMLGTDPIGKLLLKFAIPSIIAMLVSALYNMVDQIFIGNYVGELGNAATNVAFPLSTLCTATALLFGIGGAANFNLSMGRKEEENAGYYVGNSLCSMIVMGFLLMIGAQLFLEPLLTLFGAPKDVLPYAMTYTRITAFGFPVLVLSIGGGHIIRADGKPTIAMLCNLMGAITNTVLDALFVAVFGMGIQGAALATVIGQALAAAFISYHVFHFQTVSLKFAYFIPNIRYILQAASLGMSHGFNQVAMMVVQIVLNNSLKYYGARSSYGENIPIAVVGVITKVAMLYFSICIGLSQGLQPIASYNYGAKNYARTKQAYIKALVAGSVTSMIAFLLFQTIPRQITSVFGNGSEEYFEFAVKYFKIYLFFTFINNVQPLTSNFFSSIGKPKRGLFLSLTRQIIFLLPLIIIFPVFFGIDGIMYAGPIADGMAAFVSILLIVMEFRKKEYQTKSSNR